MAKAVGVGGIFLKARDPKALAQWYATHLRHPGPGRRIARLRRSRIHGHDRLRPLPARLEILWRRRAAVHGQLPRRRSRCSARPVGRSRRPHRSQARRRTPTANSRGSGIPKATASSSGSLRRRSDWQVEPTLLAAGLCKTCKTRRLVVDERPKTRVLRRQPRVLRCQPHVLQP